MQNRVLHISKLAILAIALFVFSTAASAATCDRACLLEQAKQFDANMLAHSTEKIPLASNAQIRENTKVIALVDSKWSTVKQIRSAGVYADAKTRIALVDTDRGIVIAYAILYYGNSDRRMQINEVFKILDGRIRLIDNIGLMEEGIKTSGFAN